MLLFQECNLDCLIHGVILAPSIDLKYIESHHRATDFYLNAVGARRQGPGNVREIKMWGCWGKNPL